MRYVKLGLVLIFAGCSVSKTEIDEIDVAFRQANPSFLNHQQSTFSDESPVQSQERKHRYIMGMNINHRQLDTLLSKYQVAEKNDYEVDPKKILFGVPSVSDRFSRHSLFHHKRAQGKRDGMLIDEVVGYLESHTIEPVDIPIHVVKVNDEIIAINNQDLAVLAIYGVQPDSVVKHSMEDLSGIGTDSIHEVLANLERMPDRKGSPVIFIRTKGIAINGATKESFAWEAPFARRVIRK